MNLETTERVMADLEAAAKSYAQKQREIRAEESKLSTQEIQRRKDAARALLLRAIHQAGQQAEAAGVWAQNELQLAGALDPLVRLDADQLQRAASLATFVREDFDRLGVDALVRRVRVALESDDAAERVLVLRYGLQRVESLQPGEGVDLREALAELETTVVDTSRADTARAVLDAARSIASRSGSWRYFADSNQYHLITDPQTRVPAYGGST